MNFNRHSNLEGQHAFLGASKYHWINYDEDKVATAFRNHIATQRGTELHDLAARLILLRQKLPKSQKTLNMYVNDAIGYKMTPEQMLYYSENCFGTADAISFKQNVLRIHDLKTGEIPAHMEQLMIYAALFCLEYRARRYPDRTAHLPAQRNSPGRAYCRGHPAHHGQDYDLRQDSQTNQRRGGINHGP